MAVGKLARDVSAALAQASKGKAGRKELLRVSGQILVIDQKRFYGLLRQIFPDMSEEVLTVVWTKWDQYLRGQVRNVKDKNRLMELQEGLAQLQIKPNERAYIIGSYKTISNNKGANGKLGSIIRAATKDTGGVNEAALKNIGGKPGEGNPNFLGSVLGHEEGGRGVASAGVSALRAESIVSQNIHGADTTKLQEAIDTFKGKVSISLTHTQVIDANGKIKIDYIPILTLQSLYSNDEMSKIEEAAFDELDTRMKELATMPGSTPVIRAAERVLLHAMIPKNARKVTGKHQARISEKSTGSTDATTAFQRSTGIVRDSGLSSDLKKLKKKKQAPDIPEYNPTQLLGLINKNLSNVVQKNMSGPPRLTNMTGRLAQSVRLTDVMRTRQGFLSFGYTYAKEPYQVFEVGNGAPPWATPERDPRKLIDQSIRETAAQFVLGRFYTRRL